MKDLPSFLNTIPTDKVHALAVQIFTNHASDESHLARLVAYPDGHFRLWFHKSYFLLPEGQPEPTKSQWNSLKKKLKRRDPRVFVFKEHGEEEGLYYLEIGFLA